MSKITERHSDSFGHQILAPLSEQLAKSKKRALKAPVGQQQSLNGSVFNLNEHINSARLADDFYQRRFTSYELPLLLLDRLAEMDERQACIAELIKVQPPLKKAITQHSNASILEQRCYGNSFTNDAHDFG